MEGRWASLAVSAHAGGSLDFSKISRNDTNSLLKEHFIFSHLERNLLADVYKLKAFVTSITVDDNGATSQANVKNLLSTNIPWIMKKPESVKKETHIRGVPDEAQDEVSKTIAMYRNYEKNK